MARLIRELNVPTDPAELLHVISMLLQDSYDPFEVETRLNDEGKLVVKFPEEKPLTEFTLSIRFAPTIKQKDDEDGAADEGEEPDDSEGINFSVN